MKKMIARFLIAVALVAVAVPVQSHFAMAGDTDDDCSGGKCGGGK